MFTYVYLFIICFTLQRLMIPTESFASYFISRSACWVEIRDTKEEIIMHNFITPVKESPHANNVSIEVYEKLATSEKDSFTRRGPMDIETEYDTSGQKTMNVIYIEKNEVDGGPNESQQEVKVTSREYILKLAVNEEASLHDLQYVMDVKILPDLEEVDDELSRTSAEKLVYEGHRMHAELTQRNGCDNLRAFGRKGDDGLSLKIVVPSPLYSMQNSARVNIVAGWACGHEAVTLTYPLEFRPKIEEDAPESCGSNDDRIDANTCTS